VQFSPLFIKEGKGRFFGRNDAGITQSELLAQHTSYSLQKKFSVQMEYDSMNG